MRGIRIVALGLTVSGIAVGAETAPVKGTLPAQPAPAQPAPPSTGQIAKKPELHMVQPPVDLAVSRISCGGVGPGRSQIQAGGNVQCEVTVKNQGTEVAYTRDITVGAKLTVGGAEVYSIDAATRQNCLGLPMPGDLPGPSAAFANMGANMPPHILPSGEATFWVKVRPPIAPGRVDGAITLSHPRDTLGINNSGLFAIETIAQPAYGLCSVEPPLAPQGQTVKLRGYFLGLEGAPARLRFGRVAPTIVSKTMHEVDVRVPAMTCAGTGTTVHVEGFLGGGSRRVAFTLPQAQACPAPVIASASPTSVARGGIVTLNASNVGPLDPNLDVAIAFAGSTGIDTLNATKATIEEVTATQVKVRIGSASTSATVGAATLTLKNGNGQSTTSITVTP